jgi:NAD(P)-dependent dehydrogenase (short-subunit alcohol dehydrogenase family)
MNITHTVALITGGGQRIGRELALALGRVGVGVVIHYGQSAAAAQQTAAQIKAMGGQAWLMAADLADESAVSALIPAVLQQAGRLDLLINNASIFVPEDFLSADMSTWERTLRVNLTAPFVLSQAFARALPPQQPGKIINLLDATALRPQNHHFAYTISKVGLAGLTQAMAHALAGRHIQVNGIALGAILPNVNDDPARFEQLAGQIPAGRTGSPEEVVKALLYLLEADFVTGEIIRVDGGRHLV